MITILLGQDHISKQKYIKQAQADKQFEVHKIGSGDTIPRFSSLHEPALFGPMAAYVFDNCLKDMDMDRLLQLAAESPVEIFILEDTIDQRKIANKELLRNKKITVKEFESPTRMNAAKWIIKQAQDMRINMEQAAAHALATALVSNDTSKLPVDAAHNELQKLAAYANGEIITASMVAELVQPKTAIDTFALLDAIGTKEKARALLLVNAFFAAPGGDDKAKAIQFSALLADQLRNILLVQDATTSKILRS